MPRINRVRLINYGWASRRIDDLILDFHGGLNAEIRLGNGGGKSVLQRLIYQAIHPCTTVSGNRIEDYLKTKPAMTVIEWLLDGNSTSKPERITTGVLLYKTEAREDSNSIVNSFTFVSNDSAHLSLDRLPNVTSEAGVVEIEAYRISQDKYRNLSNNYAEIFYYPQDDRRKYHQKLEEFGISVTNWKEMILPMISEEDPFSALLRDSRTTDQLINGYLLRNIEKHLSRNKDNRTALRSQLSECVEMMAKQKEIRDLRDRLASYMEEHGKLDTFLDEITEKKTAFNDGAAKLSGFEEALKKHHLFLQETEEERNGILADLEEELRWIEKEEVSLAWHTAKGEKDLAEADLAEKKARLEEEESLYSALKTDREKLQAKRILDEIRAVRGNIRALEQQYQGLGQSDWNRRLTEIASTLHYRIQEEIDLLENEKASLSGRQEKIGEEKQALKSELGTIRKEIEKLLGEIGALEERKKLKEEKERALMERLQAEPLPRDFLGLLISKETDALKKTLETRIRSSERKMDSLQKIIREKEEENRSLQEEKERLIIRRTENENTLSDTQRDWEVFEERRRVLRLEMERYGLPDAFLYNRQVLEAEWEERSHKNRRENDDISHQIQLKQELLVSAKNGNVYIPGSVTSMLENYGIAFQTGENFLSEQTARERKKYLERNPLLPFSLLLNGENLAKMEEMDLSSELIRQIIPIYLYGELDQKKEEGSRMIAQVKPALLEKKQKEEFLHAVEGKIDQDRQRLDHCREEGERLNAFAQAIRQFDYTEEYEAEKQEEIVLLKKERDAAEEKIRGIQKQTEENKECISGANSNITGWNVLITKQKEDQEAFAVYLEQEEPEYQKILETLSGRHKEKADREEKSRETEDRIHGIECEESDLRLRIDGTETRIRENGAKREKYMHAQSAEILKEDSETLEAEYAVLSKKADQESGDLLARIQDERGKEREKTNEFETYAFPEETLQEIRWSEQEVKRLRRLLKEKEEIVNVCRQKETEAFGKRERANVLFETAASRLKSLGLDAPLDREEIRMNFEARRKETRRKKRESEEIIEQVKKQLQKENSVLAELSALRVIPETGPAEITLLEESLEQYRDMRNAYDLAGDLLKEEVIKYLAAYTELRDKYIGSNPLFRKAYASAPPFEGMHIPPLKEINAWKETSAARINTLQKKLDLYNADLMTLENSIVQLVHSVTGYTRRVAEALREISKQSVMRIADKASPVRLLRIELKEDLPDSSERMDRYLRGEIRRLADLCEQKSDRMDKEMEALLASRRLLEVYLEQTNIAVKVYRFDENSSHSGLVEWEKATKSNSSGEHSTSCFVIIAAMLAYMRGEDSEMTDLRKRRYETIICDNPFASISSEYLVKPLITIVDHLHLQLICFTHSTQQSIANSFDVVIQLRNTGLVSGKSRMDVDKERVLEEKMEQASLFSGVRQLSMF